MRKRFSIFMISFAIVAAAVTIFLIYNKPHRSVADEEATFHLSAPELVAAFSKNERVADSLYAGKILEINGTLKQKILDNSAAILLLGDTAEVTGVSCFLRTGQEDTYAALEVGSKVTVKGICNGLLMDVILDQCIVKPRSE